MKEKIQNEWYLNPSVIHVPWKVTDRKFGYSVPCLDKALALGASSAAFESNSVKQSIPLD